MQLRVAIALAVLFSLLSMYGAVAGFFRAQFAATGGELGWNTQTEVVSF